jgi:uroporphyrinogen-III synthase
MVVEGAVDGLLFTSSLTVEFFVTLAGERGVRDSVIEQLNAGVVGVIGEPTKETASSLGIAVDVVPAVADFEVLAECVVAELTGE